MGRLIREAKVRLDVQIRGGNVSAKALMQLRPGDVLVLDQRGDGRASGFLNGKEKWLGQVLSECRKLQFELI
jgi:flagellar motor switch protein FliM